MKNALARIAGGAPPNRKAEGSAQALRSFNNLCTLPDLDSTTAHDVQRFEEWLLAGVGCWRAARHAEQKRGGRANV